MDHFISLLVLLDAGTLLDWIDILLLPVALFLLAQFYWRKQKDTENQLKRIETQYTTRLQSAKTIWSLLEYLTEREGPKTIIVNRGTAEKPITYLRMDRAIEFIELVPKVYYQEGHGVYMTDLAERDLYDLRDQFYKLVESMLRNDFKKAGEEMPDLEGGFFHLVEERSSKIERIKNPKVIVNIQEKSDSLKKYLRNLLTENEEPK